MPRGGGGRGHENEKWKEVDRRRRLGATVAARGRIDRSYPPT